MDFTANYDMFLTEEHQILRRTVREFAEKEVAPFIREWDRSGAAMEGPETRPHIRPILKRMGELGLLGICLPARLGGAGMDYLALAVVCEELERVDSFLRVVMSVHTGLNSLTLFQWGTEEQQQKYLVPQAKGEKIAGYCLTEPNSGTDAGAMLATARHDGDHYVLTARRYGSVWRTSPTISWSSPRPTPRRGTGASRVSSSNAPCPASAVSQSTGNSACAPAIPVRSFLKRCACRSPTGLAKRARGSRLP